MSSTNCALNSRKKVVSSFWLLSLDDSVKLSEQDWVYHPMIILEMKFGKIL